MLEPISLGQGRTHCPGLAADERGVVMGRRLALFFPDVARAVGFFRSYSREVALDEILATLEIKEAISERGGRELMVVFESSGSYAADRAAQAARMHKGRPFTGTEQHFVPFRDRRSPLGYDLGGPEDLVAEPWDLVLYGEAGADKRKFGRKIQLADMILGLSPRPLTDGEREGENHEVLVVRCEQGLARSLCRYLWSRQVRATVSTAVSAKKSLFADKLREVQLVRCQGLPRHVAQLLTRTPGMRVFVPSQPHLLVEWGFRHPIALESVGSAFAEAETVLFWGPPGRTERLLASDDAVDIRDLIDVTVVGKDGVIPPPQQAPAQTIESLEVELKLARLPRASAATTALLIDRERMPWFTRLVYMLPAAILRTYEAVLTADHIIVINRRGVHGIPFGEPMSEIYPQIFVPVGMQLLPRVDYDLLREHLEIRPDQNLYFFPDNNRAFSVAQSELKPLSRAVVAPERARMSLLELKSEAAAVTLDVPVVKHRRQGAFSLWRGTKLPKPPKEKALPAPEATPTVPQLPAPRASSSEESAYRVAPGAPNLLPAGRPKDGLRQEDSGLDVSTDKSLPARGAFLDDSDTQPDGLKPRGAPSGGDGPTKNNAGGT